MDKIKKIIKFLLMNTVFRIKYQQRYKEYSNRVTKQYILFGVPEHGNIGDHAIAMAELEYLKDLGIQEVFEVPIKKQPILIKKIAKKVKPEDMIFISGGGFMGSQWLDEENMIREIVEKFPNNKIIIFPATIYYKDDKQGKREFETSLKIYQKHKQLIICTREKKSYEFAKHNYKNAQILLTPDIVLYMNKQQTNSREGILLCLRQDVEKNINLEQTQMIEDTVKKYSDNIKYTDTVVHRGIYGNERQILFEKKLKEFSEHKLVITDRLHGMIFAAITGTPCVAMGNYNYKVEGVYQWIKGLEYVEFINEISELELAIQKVLGKEENYIVEEIRKNYNTLTEKILN